MAQLLSIKARKIIKKKFFLKNFLKANSVIKWNFFVWIFLLMEHIWSQGVRKESSNFGIWEKNHFWGISRLITNQYILFVLDKIPTSSTLLPRMAKWKLGMLIKEGNWRRFSGIEIKCCKFRKCLKIASCLSPTTEDLSSGIWIRILKKFMMKGYFL